MMPGYYRGLPTPSRKSFAAGYNPKTISNGNSVTNGVGRPYNYNAETSGFNSSSAASGATGMTNGMTSTGMNRGMGNATPRMPAGFGSGTMLGLSDQTGNASGFGRNVMQQQLRLNAKNPSKQGFIDPSAFISNSVSQQAQRIGQNSFAARMVNKKYDAGPYEQFQGQQAQQAQQQDYGSGSMDQGSSYAFSEDPLAFNLDTWRQIRSEEDERAQRNRRQDNNTAAWAFFATQLANAFQPLPYDTTATARLSSQWG